MTPSPRATSDPAFWDARYTADGWAFGTQPDSLVAEHAWRIAPAGRIADLGAGEGRTAVWLAEQGFDVTAVDFALQGLEKARALAARCGVSLKTEAADLGRGWAPERLFDAVVVSFLHLLPDERLRFWQALRATIRPGGLLVGTWFHPRQVTEGYPSGGPSKPDRLVSAAEVAGHLPLGRFHVLEETATVLKGDGRFLQGPAFVTRVVWTRGKG